MKERKENSTVPLWSFVVLACIAGALAGALVFMILSRRENKQPTQNEAEVMASPQAPVQQTEAVLPAESTQSAEATKAPFELFDGAVETQIGSFEFPSEYASQVRVEDKSDKNGFKQTFSAFVGEEQVELFTLAIGGEGSGYKLGAAPDSSGKEHEIWLEIDPITPGQGWSAADVDRINRLQECVNDLIEQINSVEGFREAD